jgi:hypothetical protein
MESIRNFFAKYTNLFGTLGSILAAVTIWLGEQGCLSTGDFAATCSISWLPTSLMPWLSGLFIALTMIGKLTRPGGFLHSVFGGTAVITPKAGVGTVTPAQVAQP